MQRSSVIARQELPGFRLLSEAPGVAHKTTVDFRGHRVTAKTAKEVPASVTSTNRHATTIVVAYSLAKVTTN